MHTQVYVSPPASLNTSPIHYSTCIIVCNGVVEAGEGGGEKGRNGSGWANRVEVINQDVLSLFPSNRIIRDKLYKFYMYDK